MDHNAALEAIRKAIECVKNKQVDVEINTDIVADKILDSLDTLLFFMELERSTGLHIPENVNLAEAGYYKVANLIRSLGEL